LSSAFSVALEKFSARRSRLFSLLEFRRDNFGVVAHVENIIITRDEFVDQTEVQSFAAVPVITSALFQFAVSDDRSSPNLKQLVVISISLETFDGLRRDLTKMLMVRLNSPEVISS